MLVIYVAVHIIVWQIVLLENHRALFFVDFVHQPAEALAKHPSQGEDTSGAVTDTETIFSLARSPINLAELKKELSNYPNEEVASELAHGFEFGFPIHYVRSRLPKESKTLKSANDHPHIVRQKNSVRITTRPNS